MLHSPLRSPSRIIFHVLPALLITTLLITPALAAEGDLDTSFGTNGLVVTDISPGQNDEGHSVALQDDGKIVVVGYSRSVGSIDFAVARYKSDGTLDTTFGTNGHTATDFPSGNTDWGYSVALQDDGKIVVAGYSNNGADKDFALARYKSDGNLDTTFGANGLVTTDVTPGNDDEGNSVVLQDDGKIVVAGYSDNGSDNDFALARYKSDGALDTTFGTNGLVLTDIGDDDYAYSVALQDDGKIVVAGSRWNGSSHDITVARYKSDGNLDTTFGVNGVVTTGIIPGREDRAYSVAVQDDGKIVVAGNSWNGSDHNFALARYESDGALDATFGVNGIVTTDLALGGDDIAYSVAVQEDGKIVVAGIYSGVGYNFAIARYKSDGALDATFGANGIVQTDVTPGNADDGRSVVLQDDGKIVVVGNSDNGSDMDFAVARYIGDETAPEVSATTPADGAADQDTTVAVTAEFNEGMDEATLDETSFTLAGEAKTAVSGAVAYDADTKTATFTPDSDLDADTTYTATLGAAITDKAGNALVEYTWSFTTADAAADPSDPGDSNGSDVSDDLGDARSVIGCAMGGQDNDWAWLLLAAGMVAILARRGRVE